MIYNMRVPYLQMETESVQDQDYAILKRTDKFNTFNTNKCKNIYAHTLIKKGW